MITPPKKFVDAMLCDSYGGNVQEKLCIDLIFGPDMDSDIVQSNLQDVEITGLYFNYNDTSLGILSIEAISKEGLNN